MEHMHVIRNLFAWINYDNWIVWLLWRHPVFSLNDGFNVFMFKMIDEWRWYGDLLNPILLKNTRLALNNAQPLCCHSFFITFTHTTHTMHWTHIVHRIYSAYTHTEHICMRICAHNSTDCLCTPNVNALNKTFSNKHLVLIVGNCSALVMSEITSENVERTGYAMKIKYQNEMFFFLLLLYLQWCVDID